MISFDFHQPTQIHFGAGKVQEIGRIVAASGKHCLVVTEQLVDALKPAFAKVINSLQDSGVETVHFDGVVPNPPIRVVETGAKLARIKGCDVVLAFGGGSSIDTAKAIAATAGLDSIPWEPVSDLPVKYLNWLDAISDHRPCITGVTGIICRWVIQKLALQG